MRPELAALILITIAAPVMLAIVIVCGIAVTGPPL
jgi:hypothetical protein